MNIVNPLHKWDAVSSDANKRVRLGARAHFLDKVPDGYEYDVKETWSSPFLLPFCSPFCFFLFRLYVWLPISFAFFFPLGLEKIWFDHYLSRCWLPLYRSLPFELSAFKVIL